MQKGARRRGDASRGDELARYEKISGGKIVRRMTGGVDEQ